MAEKLTPMMDQYLATKQDVPGCLLFFRLGDFYEMFFDDALTASRELEITLTARSCGQDQKAPMCGVPYHAAEGYIQKLISKGYKVAICEQMEDPKAAKGLVKREITRIVTPGTSMAVEGQGETENQYIVSINGDDRMFSLAVCDVTTGFCAVTQMKDQAGLLDEIDRYRPQEILICDTEVLTELMETLQQNGWYVTVCKSDQYDEARAEDRILRHFGVLNLEGLGLNEMPLAVGAAGALLEYLTDTQKRELTQISRIDVYTTGQTMVLDAATRRNLELTETLRDKKRRGSLLWVLDKTHTAMGGRMLKNWIEAPLIDAELIHERQDCVGAVAESPMLSDELKELLESVYDMERLIGRVCYGSAGARDLIALKTSLSVLPVIRQLIGDFDAPWFHALSETMDPLEDLHQLLEDSIYEEPPLTLREGHLIKDGYNETVDQLRSASKDGRQWLLQLEAEEKEKTGIKNLKIGYNRVFGYYIEVSKGSMSLVPDRYIRRQTLANGERYITEELKAMEDTLLGAQDKVVELEYDLFVQIRRHVAGQLARIQKTASQIAQIDCLRSLGEAAYKNRYVRPEVERSIEDTGRGGILEIEDGRHPVVEQMIEEGTFIPNDTYLDLNEDRMAIITGPNMAGKSTYMRQVAVIQLMAQIGSFVPASYARLSIVDRIFTRVGASDDLAGGQSTFMVEMSEVSNILRHATNRSLLILDEIGRGTSTYDGLSIAWAVAEYISDPKLIGARTLFATHYHELTQIEGQIPGVKNYCVSIREQGEDVVFLRKVTRGSGDQSYGIEVARLAGLPSLVVARAHEILDELLEQDVAKRAGHIRVRKHKDEVKDNQLSMFDLFPAEYQDVIDRMKAVNLNEMTPLEAMNLLYAFKKQLEGTSHG